MKSRDEIVFAFPGQGSQAPGMAEPWLPSAAARAVLEEASEALQLNLAKLMAPEADAAKLTQTENAQPALLVVGLMAAAALQEATSQPLPALGRAVAGHSLGEYTAVAAAGGLGVAAAARLVRLRGEAMASAPEGGMSAVLGLSAAEVETAIEGLNGIYFANDNANGQAVISGELAALPGAEEALKAAGAKRVLRLPVSGAFHTPLQNEAHAAVGAWLASHPIMPLILPCWMNISAQQHESESEVSNNLKAQITGRVRWRESMINAAEDGTRTVIELGCGKVLAGLAPRCDERLSATSLFTHDMLLQWLDSAA